MMYTIGCFNGGVMIRKRLSRVAVVCVALFTSLGRAEGEGCTLEVIALLQSATPENSNTVAQQLARMESLSDEELLRLAESFSFDRMDPLDMDGKARGRIEAGFAYALRVFWRFGEEDVRTLIQHSNHWVAVAAREIVSRPLGFQK